MNIKARLAAVELARRNLLQFTLLTMKNYKPNWHHRVLANKLMEIESGKIDRLMVLMPPRHGKSELASVRFPAWYLGRNPDRRIIGTSYSAELATDFGRKVRDLIRTERFVLPFKGVSVKDDSSAANRWDIKDGGGYVAAGVGGSVTGRGGDLLIVDDPFKNQEDADSKTYRDKVWSWYQSTLYTRIEKGGAIIVILTRWHEDDLAGKLISEMLNDGDQWDIVSFPAIAEEKEQYRDIGDALWPDKYDEKELARTKMAVGSRVWTALYQQRPAPAEGAIFKKSWFRFYDRLPDEKHIDRWLQSWDMTFTNSDGSDYVVGQVWACSGADRYLVDQVRERMDFMQAVRALRNMSDKYPQARAKYIEDKANGPAVISALKNEIQGLIPVNPTSSKVSRANAVSPILEAGNVYLKRGAKFSDELIEEAGLFPSGKNDDQVDAMTQALSMSEKSGKINAAPAGIPRSANSFSSYSGNKSALRGY
jgi:predicted phage terminase large subunit-like protein